jgi:hypothetical protein
MPRLPYPRLVRPAAHAICAAFLLMLMRNHAFLAVGEVV